MIQVITQIDKMEAATLDIRIMMRARFIWIERQEHGNEMRYVEMTHYS